MFQFINSQDTDSNSGVGFIAAKPKPSGEVAQVSVEMQLPKVEALDDFEYRVLGTASDLDDTRDDDFLRELDEIGRSARGIREYDEGEEDSGADEDEDWDDDKAQVLTDLALSNLEEFDLEDEQRPYRLRADRLFFPGQLYDPEVCRVELHPKSFGFIVLGKKLMEVGK